MPWGLSVGDKNISDEKMVFSLMTTWDWTKGELAKGLLCYRAERFFDAHEHWEGVWLQLQGAERIFLQALIQLTVAFHHCRSGNYRGMQSMLQRALGKLESYPESYGGVAVASLRVQIRECLQRLETAESTSQLQCPRIIIG